MGIALVAAGVGAVVLVFAGSVVAALVAVGSEVEHTSLVEHE